MASARRRFPEIDPEAEELIVRLVTEHRADMRPRPRLISVTDWSTLSQQERRLITKARADSKAQGDRGRATERSQAGRQGSGPRRSASRGAKRSGPPPREHMTRRQRYAHRRLSWLKQRIPEYRLAHGWERTAWLEAYDRRRIPVALRVLLGSMCFVAVTYLTGSWIWGAVSGFLTIGSLAAAQHIRIRRTAQHLLDLFTEAQEQSRHIPAAVRQAVLDRDRNACRNCGATQGLHIDHKIPYSWGGTSEMSNLQTLCGPCNLRKGARQRWLDRRRTVRRAARSHR